MNVYEENKCIQRNISRMSKQSVVYTYNEISLNLKKEGNSDTRRSVDDPWRLWCCDLEYVFSLHDVADTELLKPLGALR